MDTLLRYRGYVVLTLIFVMALGGYILYDRRPQIEPVLILTPTATPSRVPTVTPTLAPMQVHVAGAIQNPGVYTLPPGSRVVQAVEAAGGLASDADQEKINLADTVRDGQQVYIPHLNTPAPPSPTSLSETAGKSAASSASSSARTDSLVNINMASAAELQTLHGIGPALAERVIAYRQANGPFADPSDITKVKGIGDAVYEQNKARIMVH